MTKKGIYALFILFSSLLTLLLLPQVVSADRYVTLEDLPGEVNIGGIVQRIGITVQDNQRLDLFALVIVLYLIFYNSLTLKINKTGEDGQTTQTSVQVFDSPMARYIFSAILAVVVAGVIPPERRRLLLVFIGGVFLIHFIFQKLGLFSQIESLINRTTGAVNNTVPGSGLIKILIKIGIWIVIIWLIYVLLMSFARQLPILNQLGPSSEIMGPLELIGNLIGVAQGQPTGQGSPQNPTAQPNTVFTSVKFWWNEVSVYGPQVNDIINQLENPNIDATQQSTLCQNALNILIDCLTGSISGRGTQECSEDFVNTKVTELNRRGCSLLE